MKCFWCEKEFKHRDKVIQTQMFEVDLGGEEPTLQTVDDQTEMLLHVYCLTKLIKETP